MKKITLTLFPLAILLLIVLSRYPIQTGQPFTPSQPNSPPVEDVAPNTATDPVIVAAGDIACDNLNQDYQSSTCHHVYTANLIEWINPDAILILGDLQYPTSSYENLLNFYHQSWGKFYDITYPAPGNHEYYDPNNAGYIKYFSQDPHADRTNDLENGFYSFNLGTWHLLSLNTELDSAPALKGQLHWLETELQTEPDKCTLAFFHRPRFSSGPPRGDTLLPVTEIWNLLVDHGVDVALAGHDHFYQRLAPLKKSPPTLKEDLQTDGVRQFIVGTGGKSLTELFTIPWYSEFAFNGNDPHRPNLSGYGVLKMTLHPTSYDWQFISDDPDHTVIDSGSDDCFKSPQTNQ